MDRRGFMQTLAAGSAILGAGAAAGAERALGNPASTPNPDFHPDVELELAAASGEAPILPGPPTPVWRFQGKVVKGDPTAFQTLPGSALPVIRVRRGQKIRIVFHNRIELTTIVHWHGLHVPDTMDGHPRFAIGPGNRYVYEFAVDNRAGTYWFHPHPHGRTGEQVYFGLAGLFIVHDDEEAAARLPAGEFDIAWVIQDRRFDPANRLVYLRNMMERMQGLYGDRILVNGRPDFVQPVATAAYRVRLLNGSNARIYRLAWDDGRPVTVIGTDGGLLERPVARPYVVLAPAQRVELWLDCSDRAVGDEIRLRSLSFGPGDPAGGGTDAFTVLKVRVARRITQAHPLPARLSEILRYRVADAANGDAPRIFRPAMGMGRAMLNGRSFEMTRAAADETVRLGDLEVWEFANDAGMMMMPHPIHVHNLQFQVLERRVDRRLAQFPAPPDPGVIDEGWHDVVLVSPGERVKLLMKFADHTGLYLYHCHVLEHEDLGMMRNYRVVAA